MIPILFDKNETLFNSGGLGFLADCTSCTVEEELNGIYECEFTYPITGPRYSQLLENRIIYATHDDSGIPQPFEIYAHSAPINGLVTFSAHHISYRLSNIVIDPYLALGCSAAVSYLASTALMPNGFQFSTDISDNRNFQIIEPTVARTILNGDENSIVSFYGGELEFDKFNVKLWSRRGTDTDVEIRYGKNLKDLTDKVDSSETYNAIVPYWISDDRTQQVFLNRGYVYHDDGSGKVKAIALSMRDYFKTKPTKQDMKDKAEELLEGSFAWVPAETIEVDFAALWQTKEYAQYAPLQHLNLGDTLRVYYPALGVDAVQEKVVKTVYNTLLDRYDEITLNQVQTTLGELISSQTTAEVKVTASDLASVVNLAVQLVQGASGGNIYTETDSSGYPVAFYLMDTKSTSTAVNVLKLNNTGFSISTTGFNGTYSSIMSIDSSGIVIDGDLTVNGTIHN